MREEQESDQFIDVMDVTDIGAAEPPVAVPHAFHVCDAETANWVLRHIAAAAGYKSRVKAWAEAEVRRAEREEEWFRRRFAGELVEWTRGEVAKLNGRRKSINLPAGVLGFRKLSPKLVVDDEAAVLAWARDHFPKAIVTVVRLDKASLNQLFEEAGEIPDGGAHVEPAGEKFYLR